MSASPDRLIQIEHKLDHGERLDFEDGLALFEWPNPLDLARLANRERERRWGGAAFYNVNLHINPANSCVMGCRFCAFGRRPFEENAYIRPPGEIVERARRMLPERCTEIHLVGGLDPRLKVEYYEGWMRALREAFPHIHLKALTPVEVVYIARVSRLSIPETLDRLLAAGMNSMPGGGAEIFDPEIREQICEHKCGAGEWFEVHRLLHARGIPTNCTMLFGHIEEPRHRVDHMLRLRDHQDRYGGFREGRAGFQCFIPLAFHPENTDLERLPGPTALDALRTIAAARLLLDNIPHIKAYWIGLGVATAQTALWFGADDFDGVVTFEEIFHDAGSRAPLGLAEAQIRHQIREAGRQPVLRDSTYNTLEFPGAED